MRKAAKSESDARARSLHDPLDLLLFSDKPGILHLGLTTFRSAGAITLCSNIERLHQALQTRPFHAILVSPGADSAALHGVIASTLDPNTPIILIASETTFQPSMLFAARHGIIDPTISPREFRGVLAEARAGHFVAPAWFNRSISATLRLGYVGYRRDFVRELQLTDIEVMVMDALAQHLENKEIAGKLGLSEPHVSKLLRSAYSKLGVHRRTEAAVFWSKLLD